MDKNQPKIPLFNLKKTEKEEIILNLEKNYGSSLSFLKEYNFYMNSKGKTYISKINLSNLNLSRINTIGLYFGTLHENKNFRPSIEGSNIIKPIKNYAVIEDEILKNYISGQDLFAEDINIIDKTDNCQFIIVKNNNNFIGSISIKEKNVFNYIPKSRRLNFNKLF